MKYFFYVLVLFPSLFCIAQNQNIEKGLGYYNSKKFPEAIESFTKAIMLDPNNMEVYFFRGLSKFEIKDYYGVIKDFKKILQFKIDDQRYTYMSYYTLGLSYFYIKDYGISIVYLDSALIVKPNSAEVYLARGKSKINIGKIKKGCEDFSLAGELGDKNAYNFIQQYCVGSVITSQNENWIKYGETPYFVTYYNSNVLKTSDSTYSIKTQQIINEKNYETAKQVLFGKMNNGAYRNLKYMEMSYSVNTTSDMIRRDSVSLFNKDNSLIETVKFGALYKSKKSAEWIKPIRNSIEGSLIDIVKLRYIHK